MLRIFRDRSFKALRWKLITLLLLNTVDACFTYFLIGTGHFEEINIILKNVVSSGGVFFSLKIMLPILLVSFVFVRIKDADERQLKVSNLLINAVLILYVLTDAMHVFWAVSLNFI